MTEQSLQYAHASQLTTAPGRSALELATSGGSWSAASTASPVFFDGFVEHADAVATAMLVVGRVARTRFYVPPNMLAAVLRAADPVVTSTPEGLRLESFSPCAGVYARLDLDASALDTSIVTSGVTNVDFNPEMRGLLASVAGGEPMRLTVGSADFTVSTLDDTVTEKKVPLPERWLRSFAEAQVVARQSSLRIELGSAEARRFVADLPRSSSTKSVMWASPSTRGVRLASRPAVGAACIAGPERLRVLEPVLRFSTGLRGYDAGEGHAAASFWQVDLPMGRLVIGLSPEKARGFSGEGQLLDDLLETSADDDADVLSARIAFDPRIEPESLATELGLPEERVRTALAALASQGQLGYDLQTSRYFHRPLPYARDLLQSLHPRLAGARSLVDAGAVTLGVDATAVVSSKGASYTVRLSTPDRTGETCTCAWYGKYRGTRGACKHVLAARMVSGLTA